MRITGCIQVQSVIRILFIEFFVFVQEMIMDIDQRDLFACGYFPETGIERSDVFVFIEMIFIRETIVHRQQSIEIDTRSGRFFPDAVNNLFIIGS